MFETLLTVLIALVIVAVILWFVQQLGLPRPIYLAIVAVLVIVILLWLVRHLGLA